MIVIRKFNFAIPYHITDMTEDFKEHIKDLVSDIFSEEILVTNKLGNSEISGKKWYDLVKVSIFILR